MANVSTINYTPPRACDVVLTASFEATSTGQTDFGGTVRYYLVCDQGGTVQASSPYSVATARQRYNTEWRVPVASTTPCVFTLVIITGTGTATLYNIEFKAEVIKA